MKNIRFKVLRLAAVALVGGFYVSAPVLAEPVVYVVDPAHTFASFSYDHLGLSTQTSRFDTTEGVVVYDAVKQTAEVRISIDLNSISTGSAKFDEHLKGADFFNVEKFPRAVFRSTEVHFKEGFPAKVMGNLTIRGVTRPVVMKLGNFSSKPHPMTKKQALGANASFHVNRSEFDLGKYVPMVGDEVKIKVSLEASQE
jgi:polyisoprenoid-binding protein YceI